MCVRVRVCVVCVCVCVCVCVSVCVRFRGTGKPTGRLGRCVAVVDMLKLYNAKVVLLFQGQTC